MLSRFKKSGKQTAQQPQPPAAQKSLLDAFVPATQSWPSTVANTNNGSFLSQLNKAEQQANRPIYDNWQQPSPQQPGAQQPSAQQPSEQQSAAPQEQPNVDESLRSQSDQIKDLAKQLSQLKSQRATQAQTPAPQPIQQSAPTYQPAAPARASAQHSDQPTLQTFLSFGAIITRLLSAWWLILILALAGMILAAGYAVMLPNKYESVAEILIEPRETVVLEGGVAPTGLNREATIAYAESQVRIISSSSVIDLVIEELELQEDPEFNGQGVPATGVGRFVSMLFGRGEVDGDPVSNAKSYLYENFYVLRINQTFTLQIGVTTADPQKSALIANTIARIYMSDESIARSAAARNANQDLSGRLGELQSQVRASEQAVEEYRAENGLIDAEGKLLSEVQLSRLSEQLALAKVQAGDARTKAEQAQRTNLSDVISGSVPSSLATNTVSQLRVEYARARSQLARVSTTLGERHPDRIGAQSEFNSARNALTQEMRRIVASAQDDFKRARARQADLERQVNELKASAVTDSAAKVRLRELTSQLDANRKIYEMVLLRSRETGEQEVIQPKTARIISAAVAPDKKNGPNRKLIVAGGGIVGGALGGFLALLPLLAGATRVLMNPATAPVAPVQPRRENQPTDDLYGNPASAPSSQNQEQQREVAAPVDRASAPVAQNPVPNAPVETKDQQPEPASPAMSEHVQVAAEQPVAPQPAQAQPMPAAQPAPQPMQPQMAQPQPVQMQMPLMNYQPQMMGYPMPQPMPQPMVQPVYVQAPPMVPQPMPMMMYPVATPEPEKKS